MEECDSCGWDDLPLHSCGQCENCCTCRPATYERRSPEKQATKYP